jgi:two-component system CheB/CheR fusion protein
MLIHKIKTLKQYAGFLGQKNNEVELLHQDLLINVTDFFRDAEAFQFLKTTVLPRLLKSKAQGEPIRIWVAACATGEEVYSIAMMLLEIQDNKTNTIPFQIFASDLSAEAISIARIGEYSMPQLKNISPKRLQRFFIKSRDKYRISKSLRDVCVFAHHNILRDPPFSRMDFISCRNLLIYLDTSAQKKAIATFHYALNDEGCLLLGKSETIGTAAQLFSPLSKKFKIYSRKKNSGSRAVSDMAPSFSDSDNGRVGITLSEKRNTTKANHKKIPATTNSNLTNTFDSVLLSRYMPASVIISHDMEVLEFRGSTELYLKHSSGKASFNILKMARAEIVFELRNAIHHAIKTKKTICKTGIEIKIDSALRIVNLEVSPIKIEVEEPLLLVVFTEQQHPDSYLKEIAHATKGGKNNSIVKDRRIKKLEEELAAARSDMGAITHDQEAANEELQSANEEIVSSNEEMQSLNEELETSKEEIESTNEELTTSNQELNARIQQVEELYNYSEAILSTIHEPMLILDKDIRIKSANKSFCKLFHVTEEETIGISLFKLGNNQWNVPRLRELLEDIVPKNIRIYDFEVEYTFSGIGHKIMLLNAHRIIQQSQNEELIVLAITDITESRAKAIEPLKKDILKSQLDNTTLKLENQKAEELVKAKQQFLSNMSHEIRTPMNSIIGFTNVILKTDLNKEQKEYISAIKVSGDALLVLINDILDLAKVDAGKMNFEQIPFNLFESISSMLLVFENKILEKNLELVKEYGQGIPENIEGDPMRLRQIILNLISNSVKFTEAGKIALSVRVLKEDAEKVTMEFSVTDTGIGIPEDKLENIFEDFQQVAYADSKLYGGTGLGLSIVKQLVERQGGAVMVKSKVGQGSTFSFTLSFKKTTTTTTTTTDVTESAKLTKNIKVLVVEDIPLNQLLVKTLLLDFGFQFDIVGNGKIAIEKLKKDKYDIILMDLQMPEMNGFEATKYIRDEMNSQIPIIALTADVTSVDVEKSKAIGMNDYISKPIDEKILYSKIIQYLKKSD